jgi:ribosomal protein L34E
MRPALRTHSKLKKLRMTPGGRHKLIIKEWVNKERVICEVCGKQIHGKSKNRCTTCSVKFLKNKVRGGQS